MIRFIRFIYERMLIKEIKPFGMPNHVAIIMDGNRRFARRRGLPPQAGHVFGSRKAEEVLNWCWELGIKNVTVYAFSTENFNRSEEEKQNIFKLVAKELRRLAKDRRIHRNRVKVKVIGKLEMLPEYVREAIREVEKATQGYGNFNLNIALAYGGRQELIDAIRGVLHDVRRGVLRSRDIDAKTLEKYLYGEGDYASVDLVIRTGGEQRLSNFLPWQTANSVAYFCDAYWPEFRKIDLLRAIRAWQQKKMAVKKPAVRMEVAEA
ncbi:polyprenyl diphosphate synthase [Archaeoglobus veneficus]|uniref:Tritrans,polycis-undecaprenyl-diphosphate synthase (geranylgeranyl-diphosphate specific) n=1 Tax=Archaeoglobus veneficus (strain DSM 11195 / SNP6) TaxID=693661 RepID=F2KN65_ARCVS|nr:polyprenyl diphosphate synthase [Archaeoglobus veneficus]AEA46166.1 Undecaprenyl pyrophosphate synthase [Archaeoglobus veneficus SNP6]